MIIHILSVAWPKDHPKESSIFFCWAQGSSIFYCLDLWPKDTLDFDSQEGILVTLSYGSDF